MTTLPTPETLRSRAAVALACAESAPPTGRPPTDAARTPAAAHPAVALAGELRAFGLDTPAVAAAEALLARGERSLELSSVLRCELLSLLPRGPMPPSFRCDGVLWDERAMALDERIMRIGGDR